jgi:hypothetical protein
VRCHSRLAVSQPICFRLSYIQRVRQQDTALLFFIVKVRQKISRLPSTLPSADGNVEKPVVYSVGDIGELTVKIESMRSVGGSVGARSLVERNVETLSHCLTVSADLPHGPRAISDLSLRPWCSCAQRNVASLEMCIAPSCHVPRRHLETVRAQQSIGKRARLKSDATRRIIPHVPNADDRVKTPLKSRHC